MRDNPAQLVSEVVHAVIMEPSTVNPASPPELDHVVMGALARTKSKRYETALDVAKELEHYLFTRPEPFTAANVGQQMQALFEKERLEREELLRAHTPRPSLMVLWRRARRTGAWVRWVAVAVAVLSLIFLGVMVAMSRGPRARADRSVEIQGYVTGTA